MSGALFGWAIAFCCFFTASAVTGNWGFALGATLVTVAIAAGLLSA